MERATTAPRVRHPPRPPHKRQRQQRQPRQFLDNLTTPPAQRHHGPPRAKAAGALDRCTSNRNGGGWSGPNRNGGKDHAQPIKTAPAPAKRGPQGPRKEHGQTARQPPATRPANGPPARAKERGQGITPTATYNAASGHGNGHGGQGLHQGQHDRRKAGHTDHQPQPQTRRRRREPCQNSRRKRTTPNKGRTNPEREEASRRRVESERLERLRA